MKKMDKSLITGFVSWGPWREGGEGERFISDLTGRVQDRGLGENLKWSGFQSVRWGPLAGSVVALDLRLVSLNPRLGWAIELYYYFFNVHYF